MSQTTPNGPNPFGSDQVYSNNIQHLNANTISDGTIIMQGGYIHNVNDPILPSDVATKSYVDNNPIINPTFDTVTVLNEIITPIVTGLDLPTDPSMAASKFYVDSQISGGGVIQNLLVVQLDALPGQFSSVKAALDSITDASPTNPYCVSIGPGVYTEEEMIVPAYVSVKGSTIDTTIIKPAVPNQHVFIMSINTELSFLTLQGISGSLSPGAGTGYSAIYCEDTGDTFVQTHKVSIYDFDIAIENYSNNADSNLYVEYTDINGNYSTGVFNHSNPSGSNPAARALLSLENFFSFPSTSTTKTVISNNGTRTILEINASNFSGASGMKCLDMKNGGTVNFNSSSLDGFTGTAVVSENVGAGQSLYMNALAFTNCVLDFSINNPSTTGYFFGNSPRSNHFINSSSTFFMANESANVIRVAKSGGDFSSIRAAVMSITDSSESNPYLISVAPGIYTEQPITLQTGISIVGAAMGATVIQANSVNDTIITGIDGSIITNVTITGATGSSGKAIYFSSVSTNPTTNFIVRNCILRDNYTHAHVHGAVANCPTELIVDNCYVTGDMNTGFIADNVGSVLTILNLNTLLYDDLVAPTCTYFVTASEDNTFLNFMNNSVSIGVPNSATAIQAFNGAKINCVGSLISGFDTAIHVPAVSSGTTTINGAGMNIVNSGTWDINIENVDTTGKLLGVTTYTKVNIPILSTFYLFGQDVTIITVQKAGGDFTSVAAAMNSITGAGPLNRYVVKVGSGAFVEPAIMMKQYTAIIGAGRSTIIGSDGNAHHIIYGNLSSEIDSCTLTGAVTGYAAVYQETPTGTQQNAFVCRNIIFGINDIHAWAYGNVGVANITIFASIFGGLGQFNYGFRATNNNNSVRGGIRIMNSLAQDFTSPLPINLCYASGDNCTISVNGFLAVYKGVVEPGTVAFRANNAGHLHLLGTNIEGFETGILVDNIGDPADVIIVGSSITDCTTDINIQHPGTMGSIDISAARSKIIVNGDPPVSLVVADIEESGFSFSGPFLYSKQNFSNLTDISSLIANTPTMGLIKGATISAVGTSAPLDVMVSAGFGYQSVGADPDTTILKYREWPDTTISLSATNSNYYIYMNTSGTIVSATSYPDTIQNILYGLVSTDTNSVSYIQQIPVQANHYTNGLDLMLKDGVGPLYSSGSTVQEFGTRQLTVTQGIYFFTNIQFTPGGGSPVTFDAYYRSATPGLYTQLVGLTTVQNTQYDNGTGTLANLTAGYYVKHLLLLVGGPSESYVLVYGQEEYSSQGSAEAGSLPITPAFVTEAFTRVASIVVQQGTTNIVSIIDERPRVGFASSSTTGVVTVHGDLLGLAANDHPQYLLVNGGAPGMLGTLNMNSNNITNVGLFNGFNVSAHASRHQFNGADPLTAAMAGELAEISDTTAFAGINNVSIPRADHQHAHGNRGGGTLHAVVVASTAASAAGFMSGTDKVKLDSIQAGATNTTASTAPPLNVSKSTALAGTSAEVSRADHKHDINTAAAVTISATSTNLEGSSTSLARADHTHNILTAAVVTQVPDQANAEGNAASFARSDHIHNIPSGVPVGLNANSSTSQGAAASFAISNHSHAIASGPPTAAQVFGTGPITGTSINFARADHVHVYATESPLTINTVNFVGTSSAFAKADHKHAHGSQTDPTMHSLAVAGSNAGFMSGTDKAIVDAIGNLSSGSMLIGSTANTTIQAMMIGDASLSVGPLNSALLTLSDTGVIAGTYSTFTTTVVDSKGRLVSASSTMPAASILIGSTGGTPTARNLLGDIQLGSSGGILVTRINSVPLGIVNASSGFILVGDGSSLNSQSMSGDAIMNSSAVVILSTSGVTSGVYSFPSLVSVDSKGRVLSMSSTMTPASIIVGNTSGLATAVTVSGDASLSAGGVITLSNSGVISGTYLPTSISVNQKGLVTNVLSSMSPASIIIGNTGSVPEIRNLSGDIVINSTGGTTVTSINKIPLDIVSASSGFILVGNGSSLASQQMNGDAVLSSSAQIILSTTSVVAGQYSYPTGISVDSKGRLTSVSSTLSSASIIVGSSTNFASAVTMSGDASIGNTGILVLATTGITNGSYSLPTNITVDAKGRVINIQSSLQSGTLVVGSSSNVPIIRIPGGDVVMNNLATFTVTGINGNVLGTTSNISGNMLISDGTAWNSRGISGDAIIGGSGGLTVTRVNGVPFVTLPLASGNILVCDGNSFVTRAMSGDATISSSAVLTLSNSGVISGTYPNATIVVDTKGRVVNATQSLNNVLSGVIGSKAFPVFSTVVYTPIGASVTLTAAQFLSSYIDCTNNGATNITLPTATSVISAIGITAYNGMSFTVYFRKINTGAGTLVGGSGFTFLNGSTLTITANNTRGFICNITSTTGSILMLPLGQSPF